MKIWKFIIALGLLAVTVLLVIQIPNVQDRLFLSVVQAAYQQANLPQEDSLSAVICGSRSPLSHPTRAEACVLIIAGKDIYVVDAGAGSVNNLMRWRIPFSQIRGVLISHLHSDHIADLPGMHLQTWVRQNRPARLDVYGPRGVGALTKGLEAAYSTDYFLRNAHHGDAVAPLNVVGMQPHAIDMAHPVIVKKNGLTITAFEVEHEPVKPAFGYRFDYKGRSIVVSGDTIYSENLIRHARDADVLIHEAQANHILKLIQEFLLQNDKPLAAKIMEDIVSYHTSPVEAAKAANEANVKHLILYHLTPAPSNWMMENIFVRGVDDVRDDGWTLSEDGTMVILPVGSDDVEFSGFD